MRRGTWLGALALAHLGCVSAACTFDRSGVPVNSATDASSAADSTGPPSADAAAPVNPPIGQWTFNSGQELVDTQGNFPDLVLKGDAAVNSGRLDINGSGSDASGWAVTGTDSGLYIGPDIVDKTLVSWISLEQLKSGDGVWAGSAITIDRETSDHFDGLIFAERQDERWMSGSSNFSRTDDFDPGFQEIGTGIEVMLAITYDDIDDLPGGTMDITGYRNGAAIGSYSSDSGSSWPSTDAEILFGKRHGDKNGGPGALDAVINEAHIYDYVLSATEIETLVPQGAN
jgi:hypothetical protein